MRSDYWLNALAQCLVYYCLVSYSPVMILGGDSSTYTSDPYSFSNDFGLYCGVGIGVTTSIASLVPSIAIIVRRLRDAGYHWALIFLSLIPYLGGFIIFILTLQPTKVEVAFNNFNNPQQ
ncbi:MAG: DUF805 domain-containing protein [Streptococcus thermophilus]